MSLARKIKSFVLWYNGTHYAGTCEEVTLPKLSRKMDEFRAGGMDAPVEIDLGMEKLTLEFTIGDTINDLTKRFAESQVDGVPLRLMASAEADDNATINPVEIAFRGRFTEIDMGNFKPGDSSQTKFSFALSYYKYVENGNVILEIDVPRMILVVDGVDLYAERRRAVGLNY